MGFGFENSTAESRITFKEKNETFEIISKKTEDCDNAKSYSIDYLLEYVIPEQICDITINIAKITILELSYCNLTVLPIECKKLNLKHLGLSHNKLTEVPLCLYSGLKYLESLDLSFNSINRFDIEPECLPYIKIIKLNNNTFENVPKWFLMFKCTNIEEFNYSHNKAKNYKYLKNSMNQNIIKLRKLELKNNYLIDDDYNFLKIFNFLEYLDISNEGSAFLNKFNEVDNLFVKPRWKELFVLRLNGLSLSILPEGIAWIYTLKELYVRENSLSWLPDSINFLVNLEYLDISNNSIVAIPLNILSLEKLTILQASNNCIDSLPDMSRMANLNTLDLYHNYLEAITFSVTNFDCVDLEFNYCNTENLEECSAYQEKKNRLRRKYEIDRRYDGPKEMLDSDDSNDSYHRELDPVYYYDVESISLCPANIDEEEDWDLPVKVKNRNLEIDSVDDEWDGEEKTFSKTYRLKEKVYVSDDDWMFTDYELS